MWSQSGEERRKGGAKGVELTGRSCESKPQGGKHLGEGVGKLRARARGNEAWLYSSRKTSVEAFFLMEAEGDEDQEGYSPGQGLRRQAGFRIHLCSPVPEPVLRGEEALGHMLDRAVMESLILGGSGWPPL